MVLRLFLILGMAAALDIESVLAHEAEPIEFSPIGIPYAWLIELEANEVTATEPDHVGAWSWDEDGFPDTAKGWTHTSAWVKLDISEPVNLTLVLESLAGVPWPSAEEPGRLAGTNRFPSFTLYRGWDTDAGVLTNSDGTTLDQDHTYNNRGDIAWAEDVTYLDHVDNAVEHSITRTWTLPAGHYTVALGGNSPATVAEGRQGYRAVFGTTPPSAPVTNAALSSIAFSPVGIPYSIGLTMDDQARAETAPDHVGAWSWDEDGFPETARGWTHTSSWIKLRLTKPALLTLNLASREGVPWPSAEEPFRLAGTNLFPSFTLYHGWDTDAGLITNLDGTTLDQNHTFNNRGNIEWAEDVTYLNHLDNATAHQVSRTWLLAAGEYTINLGGNSPALVAEGRQGFRATFTTAPAPVTIINAALTPVEFNPVGIPYGWDLTLGADGTAQTLPDHVGAWSWDEDGFPATTRGWTHTSKWVKLNLTEPALLTFNLESLGGVPWPSAEEPGRLAGTNLFPSFTLYRGWDTDAGLITNLDGTTLDQNHTFNNRGNVEWVEDVTFLDYLDNGAVHKVSRTWSLPAGAYTLNLGGNSPALIAEGQQGYLATFTTVPAAATPTNAVVSAVEYSPIGIPYAWKVILGDTSSAETAPDFVGAWSWDEDGFPATEKGWTHTSRWVQVELLQPAALTLKLESRAGVPWPAADDPSRLAGTNLYPSFSIYTGWDTDTGSITNLDGTTLDQDHTYNNRGNIVWAEDVFYLDHLDNAVEHTATRSWNLPAGRYTVALGGNSPAAVAEGNQGYRAVFTTTPAPIVSLAPSGDEAVVTWSTSYAGWHLGRTSQLGTAFAPVVTPPSEAHGLFSVRVPITGSSEFYTLQP